MDDLKLMTVRALRELARDKLGPGYSKLKTKAELIAALAKQLASEAKAKARPSSKQTAAAKKPEPKVEAKKPEPKVEAKKPEPKVEAKKPEPKVEAKKPEPKVEAKKPEPKKPEPKVEAKPEPVKPAAKKPEPKVAEADHRAEILATLRPGAVIPEPDLADAEEPEVAAVQAPPAAAGDEVDADELEAQVEAEKKPAEPVAPPPRVMSQAEIDLINENLGELPAGYGDDAVQLMARDPHTLYVYWDFAAQTPRKAQESLRGARAVLRLFDEGRLIREVDVALESRSWYLHHITPGRRYRAELHFTDERGRAQRVGPASNATRVPSEGPSPVVEDRFISLPWEVPFLRSPELLQHTHGGAPFAEEGRAELMARAEEGLHQEGLRDAGAPEGTGPGQVEVYWEIVRGLGGSETMTEIMRQRTRFGGQWTSSRPAAAWTSSRPM